MEQGDPTNSEEECGHSPRPGRFLFSRIMPGPKGRGHRRKRNPDEEHARNERVTAAWTRPVGIFTIVLAVCAVANVIVIGLQLKEMHSGGVDTANLAHAAGHQASSLSDLAAITRADEKPLADTATAAKAEADALRALVEETRIEAKAAKLSANAATKGLRDATKRFELDERPIIYTDDCPDNARCSPKWDRDSNDVMWNFIIKNFGKSTAFDIRTLEFIGGDRTVKFITNGEIAELAPGSHEYKTMVYENFTEDAYNSLMRVNGGFMFIVILQYRDAIGNHYTDYICARHLASGAVMACPIDKRDIAGLFKLAEVQSASLQH